MFGVFGNIVVNSQLERNCIRRRRASAVLVVVALLFWRKISFGWNPRAVLNPIFMMMALGWLLGLKMQRFWWDWGTPAFIVWVRA